MSWLCRNPGRWSTHCFGSQVLVSPLLIQHAESVAPELELGGCQIPESGTRADGCFNPRSGNLHTSDVKAARGGNGFESRPRYARRRRNGTIPKAPQSIMSADDGSGMG